MAIVNVSTSDSKVNSYLLSIRMAHYGSEMRSALANAISRCYTLAVAKVGGSPRNGVTMAVMNEHLNRIRSALYGEEVRDAIRTAIQLCYSARGIPVSSQETSFLTAMINAQFGEDLKNAILHSIARCCQDVKS